jgi:hypothetical protein
MLNSVFGAVLKFTLTLCLLVHRLSAFLKLSPSRYLVINTARGWNKTVSHSNTVQSPVTIQSYFALTVTIQSYFAPLQFSLTLHRYNSVLLCTVTIQSYHDHVDNLRPDLAKLVCPPQPPKHQETLRVHTDTAQLPH